MIDDLVQVHITRFCRGPQGVFGRLTAPTLELFTVERPWRDNREGESCIPPGDYVCEPHDSERFPNTWAVVGGTVSHWHSAETERSAVLFHVANTIDDIEGCIGPGLDLTGFGGRWAVTDSRRAMNEMRRVLPERFALSITHDCGITYP